VLNRLVAFVLVVLCALPFTAPFSTYSATNMRIDGDHGRSAEWRPPRDVTPGTDPSALSVPPLKTHISGPVGKPFETNTCVTSFMEVMPVPVTWLPPSVKALGPPGSFPPLRPAVLRL
jgi:hypothetical protein